MCAVIVLAKPLTSAVLLRSPDPRARGVTVYPYLYIKYAKTLKASVQLCALISFSATWKRNELFDFLNWYAVPNPRVHRRGVQANLFVQSSPVHALPPHCSLHVLKIYMWPLKSKHISSLCDLHFSGINLYPKLWYSSKPLVCEVKVRLHCQISLVWSLVEDWLGLSYYCPIANIFNHLPRPIFGAKSYYFFCWIQSNEH